MRSSISGKCAIIPSIRGWANWRTRVGAGQNSQNSSIFSGAAPPWRSRQKWNWTAACRAARRLPILFRPQIVQDFAHRHGRARRFGATIDFRSETTLARLRFVLETEDRVDHGYAVI